MLSPSLLLSFSPLPLTHTNTHTHHTNSPPLSITQTKALKRPLIPPGFSHFAFSCLSVVCFFLSVGDKKSSKVVSEESLILRTQYGEPIPQLGRETIHLSDTYTPLGVAGEPPTPHTPPAPHHVEVLQIDSEV